MKKLKLYEAGMHVLLLQRNVSIATLAENSQILIPEGYRIVQMIPGSYTAKDRFLFENTVPVMAEEFNNKQTEPQFGTPINNGKTK